MPMRNPLWLFAVISLFCCCGREQLSQRLKELNTLSESNPELDIITMNIPNC